MQLKDSNGNVKTDGITYGSNNPVPMMEGIIYYTYQDGNTLFTSSVISTDAEAAYLLVPLDYFNRLVDTYQY